MKRPLEEVLKEATSGPLKAVGSAHDEDMEPAFHSLISQTGKEVANTASGDYPTRVERANASLIAHWSKYGPELVEAVQKFLDATAKLGRATEVTMADHNSVTEAVIALALLSQRAKEVEVP